PFFDSVLETPRVNGSAAGGDELFGLGGDLAEEVADHPGS
ncbi:MAG: hypothetical protein JWN00_6095, partial [Actinomycetia bacterium]|nr:hypothetical protein [Actinomycetes bacterium]